MATLIKGSPGTGQKRQRNCNIQCYNAKGETCLCVCQGKNHGVGLEKAIENTREMAKSKPDLKFNETLLKPAPNPQPRDAKGRFTKKGSDD